MFCKPFYKKEEEETQERAKFSFSSVVEKNGRPIQWSIIIIIIFFFFFFFYFFCTTFEPGFKWSDKYQHRT